MVRNFSAYIGVLLVAAALGITGTASADRRTSMAGNELVPDRDDIFRFPQTTRNYRNLLGIDYGASSSSGNAVLLFGSDAMAFGVAVHRGDAAPRGLDPSGDTILSPAVNGLNSEPLQLGGVSDVWGSGSFATGFHAPATILDLFAGVPMGDADMGFRLSVGNASQSTTAAGANDPVASSETAFQLVGGYSMHGNMDLDLGLAIGFATAGSEAGGDDQNSGAFFGINLYGRGAMEMSEGMDLGFFGKVGLNSQSYTNENAATDGPADTMSALTVPLLVGLGPVFHPNDRTVIAGHATLGFGIATLEPSSEASNDGQTYTTLLLPGVNLAFETALTDWFYVRSGLDYRWGVASLGAEDPDVGDEGSARDSDFLGWNAGVGLDFGEFTFDGTFNHAFVTNGPQFLGGEGGGLFFIASAAYTWGREDAEAPVEPPPPPPEPIYAPPPVM